MKKYINKIKRIRDHRSDIKKKEVSTPLKQQT